jgi:hypothetical protein
MSAGMTFPLVEASSSPHQRDVYQIEEAKQSDPCNASEEVNPADQHQEVYVEVWRNVDLGSETKED